MGLETATVLTIIGLGLTAGGLGYGVKSGLNVKKAAKKLPTTARARVNQLNKQIEGKEKKLFTTTNPDTREKLRLEIQDLRDEKIILEKDLEQQHDLANELSGKDTQLAKSDTTARHGMTQNTKLLLATGGLVVAGAAVAYVVSRKRKRSN